MFIVAVVMAGIAIGAYKLGYYHARSRGEASMWRSFKVAEDYQSKLVQYYDYNNSMQFSSMLRGRILDALRKPTLMAKTNYPYDQMQESK